MKNKFNDKSILITGASSGIGRQTAIDIAKYNPKHLVLVSRNIDRLNQVRENIKTEINISTYQCDVSDKSSVIQLKEDIIDKLGKLDILINNAGFGRYENVVNQRLEDIESITATNYFGMIYCTKAFLDSMIARKKGHIINVASLAASFGIPNMAAYCGSKYAMLGFSESLYHELKGTGVKITVISPIAVKTNFFNNKTFNKKMPHKLGYVLDPKKVSDAIIKAVDSSRFEITVPSYMRVAVWIKHSFPYLVNYIIQNSFKNADKEN